MIFKLLGTSAGAGVPAYYCSCKACREAIDDPQWARGRSGAFIDTGAEQILIDASPDLRCQLQRENISNIDHVFMTHWHYDHFGGLGDLEYYVRLHRGEAIPIYLPASAEDQWRAAYPFLEDVLTVHIWKFGQTYSFTDLSITPLPARHGTETAGFLCESSKSIAYFPDTAGLPPEVEARLRGVDYWVGDATFHGDNWYEHTHMNWRQMIEWGRRIEARQIVPVHMSMHYSEPVTNRELLKEFSAFSRILLSYDGMELEF